MPWKENYTTSDEVALGDNAILWPGENRMAFGLTVNLNPAATPKGVTEKDIAYPTWHFGLHEGLSDLLALLSRLRIKATFAVPAVVVEGYASIIKTIAAQGHEIALQGLLGEDPTLKPEEEAARMKAAADIFASVIGHRSAGWFALPRCDDAFATGTVTPHTIALLREQGFSYYGNGLADDAPYYWVSRFEGAESLLTLPYYYHLDDTFFLMFPHEGTGLERPQALLQNWKAEFAAQYRRGRFFNMTVSPARSGWGHRFDNLARFLTEAMSHPGIWSATCGEVAAYWSKRYPSSAHLKLEPTIWRDHSDSLS